MVTLSKTHKTTVQIGEVLLNVRVMRLTFEQSERHRREMDAIDQLTKRQVHELTSAETMTSDALRDLQALHAREDQETEQTVRTAIETYVTVEPNQLKVDGREMTTGKDLLDCFGTEPRLAIDLMYAIASGSSMSARVGKASGSPSDSTRSSGALDASGPAVDGPRPGTAANGAAPAGTPVSEAAMAETDPPSSGSTATLN
jgi:hypothetical protein